MAGKIMTIEHNGKLTAIELNKLFETNNWQVADVDKLEKSIINSWCYLTARNEAGDLIGFVQAISDGIMHAYILRTIVRPDLRKMGIGTEIMTRLMEIINNNNMKPTLVATQGNDKFYERFGFKNECKGLKAMCIR
jgi:predicted GNAT family N-acyltransferase